MHRSLLIAAALLLSGLPAAAQEDTGAKAPSATELSIYRNDLALVTGHRTVELQAGEAEIAMSPISPGIVPESLNLSGDDIRLMGQELTPWPLTRERMLGAFVGKQVTLVRPARNGKTPVEQAATLLSVDGGVVVRVDGGIEVEPEGRIVFPELPEHLSAEPRATFRIGVDEAGSRSLTLRYLTRGLSWSAGYVARWDDEAGTLDLTGMATLESSLSTPIGAEKVRLVAGDVAITREEQRAPRMDERTMAMAAESKAAVPEAETRADLKVYPLKRPVTLRPGSRVQRPLLAAEGVAVERRYRIEGLAIAQPFGGEREASARLRLLVPDTRKAGLGQALPAGTVRVYDGEVFRGAQAVGDTPLGSELALDLGAAFDITAKARQKVFERIGERAYETAQEIVLKNAKDRDVTVRIIGRFPPEWTMLSESHPHEAETATQPVWTIDVPSGGAATLTYRVRVQ
ncbi:DUF4139 domain-containing protein [Ferruginivarius sediminum]|uniref:DUF4139 domain-containing protein n=1 Tax=Ferruginivarius sediminum TaxID=2661937 RepID=A0A369T778_9PROT|nr:hypothetical protein [Ferruginivarius sediminum]RDD60722.1 hypothetical protein DRB17_16820 [Ferruginivarius sediminum]